MKKYEIDNYTLYPYSHLSYEEWLEIRSSFGLALGGSDISVVMGVNKYSTLAELFDQKLGLSNPPNLQGNKSVFWGNALEDVVLEKSQYLDIDHKDSYLDNSAHERKMRNHVPFNYTIQNDNLHWLFANVDGLWVDDNEKTIESNLKKGKLPNPKAIIEIKTMNRNVFDMWENGMPIGYLYQVLSYLTQYTFMNEEIEGYIFSLVAGIELHGYRIRYDDEVINEMLERSREFYELLLMGQDIIQNSSNPVQMELGLHDIRPEADGSLRYQEYMNKKYLERLDISNIAEGDDAIQEIAEKYAEQNAFIKEANKHKRLYGNQIRETLAKMNVGQINLPKGGYVKYNNKLIIKVK
tara:strand:+ start:5214 stop:6269 length:1056 start_codon:yes stop_codon:yes gene_type:complete